MTIPSTPRKAGPFLGNGATTSFPFTFKVFGPTDIKVVIADSAGVETALVLNSDYSVTLNPNQDTSPGGVVTYPISGDPLPAGSKLSITGNLSYDQPLDLPSGGNFSPLALENQLDRTTMQIQQLAEEMDRTLRASVTANVNTELPPPKANNFLVWSAAGDKLINVSASDVVTIVHNASQFTHPLKDLSVQAIDIDQIHQNGFNAHLFDAGNGKLVLVYRKAAEHTVYNGSHFYAVDSYDGGQRWVNHRTIYSHGSFDTRNSVGAVMGNGRLGILASRRSGYDMTYSTGLFIYSDDGGKTWNTEELPAPASNYALNFHGGLYPYPAAVGGHDTNGWIAYSYGEGGKVDALYTVNNGATWTLKQNVVVPDSAGPGSGLTYSLSELAVGRVGSANGWIMVLRNAGGLTGSNSNAVAYKSTDMLTWDGPYDTGLLLKGNPPQMISEGDYLYFYTVARKGREVEAGKPNTLYVAKARAADLWANNCNFAALTQWVEVMRLPDWGTGYLFPTKINGQWYAVVNTGETPAGGASNVLALLTPQQPFIPNVFALQAVAPKPNLLINGDMQVSQRGDSFTGQLRFQTTIDGWGVSTGALNTSTVERLGFPNNGYRPVLAHVSHYLRFSGLAANIGPGPALYQRMPYKRLGDDRIVTVSFWARSNLGTDGGIRQVSLVRHHGTGGSGVDTLVVANNLPLKTYWSFYSFTLIGPSSIGKTIGPDGYDALYIYPTITSSAEDVNFEITAVKVEHSSTPTPFVALRPEDALRECQRFYWKSSPVGTDAGAAGAAGAFRERARGTEATNSINVPVRFPVQMHKTPTVHVYPTTGGSAGFMRNLTADVDVAAKVDYVTEDGCVVSNNEATVSGNTYAFHVVADARL